MFLKYDLFLDLDTGTQKPTYYELLGVLPDEQDENVIARGCEQALAKVRRYKPGDNVQVWLSILDEISNAKFVSIDELSEFNWISTAMYELAKSGLNNYSSLAKMDLSATQCYPYLVHIGQQGAAI